MNAPKPPAPRMNLLEARVVLRQRAFIDVVDLALRFVASHARVYLTTAAVVLPPAFFATWLLGRAAGWLVGWCVSLALALLVEAPFTLLASRLMFSDDARSRDALLGALAAAPRLLLVRVAQMLAVALGFALLFFPALWVGAVSAFTPEALLLEQASVGRAFARSARLAGSHVGASMMATLAVACFTLAVPFVADAAGRAVLDDLLEIRPPEALTAAGGGALSLLGFWASVPFLATVRFLFYIDLRTRSEGWDVQAKFAALIARDRAAVELAS